MARAVVAIKIGDHLLALEAEDEARSLQEEGCDQPGFSDRFTLAMAVRGFTMTEKALEAHGRPATPDARRKLLLELIVTYKVLRSDTFSHNEAARALLEQARSTVKRALVTAPFALVRDQGQTVERLAGYLGLIPELEQILAPRDFARVLLALGIGALTKRVDSATWLVDWALALDPTALDGDTRELIPEAIDATLLDELRRRKKNKTG